MLPRVVPRAIAVNARHALRPMSAARSSRVAACSPAAPGPAWSQAGPAEATPRRSSSSTATPARLTTGCGWSAPRARRATRAVAFDLPDFGETIAPDGFEHTPLGYAEFVAEALGELGDRARPAGPARLRRPDRAGLGDGPSRRPRRHRPDRHRRPARLHAGTAWRGSGGRRSSASSSRRSPTAAASAAALNRNEPRGLPREFVEAMYDHYDRRTRRAVLKLYRATPTTRARGDRNLIGLLAPRDIPALVIWGEHDAYLPSSYAAASARRFPRPTSTCCRPAATGPSPTRRRRSSGCWSNSSRAATRRSSGPWPAAYDRDALRSILGPMSTFREEPVTEMWKPPSRWRSPMTDAAAARDKRWIALILLCSAQFVVVLDASIVNVALPTIGEALDFTESSLPWVVNAYVLTFGGFLLLGGRLADLLGRRRVFMFGPGPLRPRLAGRRAGDQLRAADRRPRRPGPRRRDPLPRRALDRRHHLPRRRRAQQSAGDLGRGRRLRRRRRRAARRRPHRIPRLGMGALGQRPDRDRRRRAGAAA